MMRWRIYYADHVVEGDGEEDWRRAPQTGVQAVALLQPPERPRWHCSRGPVLDRQLWTGADEYDPFGWGAKTGTLIDDAAYQAIWERACVDPIA